MAAIRPRRSRAKNRRPMTRYIGSGAKVATNNGAACGKGNTNSSARRTRSRGSSTVLVRILANRTIWLVPIPNYFSRWLRSSKPGNNQSIPGPNHQDDDDRQSRRRGEHAENDRQRHVLIAQCAEAPVGKTSATD